MPGGDGTGPWRGYGRGAGYCAGYNAPGYVNRGMGFGRGMRCRPGWGQNYSNRPVENEQEALKNHLNLLHQEINNIQRRMEELNQSN